MADMIQLTDEDRARIMSKFNKGKPISELSDEELQAEKKRNEFRLIFPGGYTAHELLTKDFPEPDFIIPGLIPEGLTIMAGSPKIGKSWLGLQIAVALSCGGYIFGDVKVLEKTVLYLALEDTPRRIAGRLKKVKAQPNEKLHVFPQWPDDGPGIEKLIDLKNYWPELEVVIIDTLQAFRGKPNGEGYSVDYDDVSKIRALCDRLKISIILIHHTRKMEANDPVDEVCGTRGISGVVDTVLVLKKERRQKEARLFVTSRDIEETEMVLQFDGDIGTWALVGDADFVRMTRERQEIIETLQEAGNVLSTKEISHRVGNKEKNVSKLLRELKKDGRVENPSYGQYCIKGVNSGGSGGTGRTDE